MDFSDPLAPGEVISYQEMCVREQASLQRGMNFRLHGSTSILLMSRRPNAPYSDSVDSDGLGITYEGHNAPANRLGPDPKRVDQPLETPSGRPTQNGLFWKAATQRAKTEDPELVRVYEKIRPGIWVFNGLFALVDAWQQSDGVRQVCKFRLIAADSNSISSQDSHDERWASRSRVIPSVVKQQVWKRDHGRCRICGSDTELHFDHIVPFSRGGSSLTEENVQLLCARHNLQKSDKIE